MGEEFWARSKNYKETFKMNYKEFPAMQIKRFGDYQSGTEYGPEIEDSCTAIITYNPKNNTTSYRVKYNKLYESYNPYKLESHFAKYTCKWNCVNEFSDVSEINFLRDKSNFEKYIKILK